jgi:hypothetical protein
MTYSFFGTATFDTTSNQWVIYPFEYHNPIVDITNINFESIF